MTCRPAISVLFALTFVVAPVSSVATLSSCHVARARQTSPAAAFIRARQPPHKGPAIPGGTVRSLFGKDEREYERYAAALAATEPLRKQRDARAKQALKPLEYWWLFKRGKLSGGKGVCDLNQVDPNGKNAKLRAVCQTHVRTMASVIKAMGMTVSEFNALSKEVSEDAELRARVMEQAYYYRVAAQLTPSSINNDGVMVPQPEQPQALDPSSDSDSTSSTRWAARKPKPLTVAEFARCVRSVERLRRSVEVEVKQELHIKKGPLPPGMCDQTFLPMLNPKVRKLCSSFPDRATSVVKAQGVDAESFNVMLRKAQKRRHLLLRWRLGRMLKTRGG